jgi:tetratricopeptide (TPR) repeat protein
MTDIGAAYSLCKNCGTEMPLYIIRSFNTFGPMHTDFYQENGGSQIVHYDLSICPKCLFVGTEEEFKESEKKYSDHERKLSWEQLSELEKKYPPTRRYIMLAERLEKEGGSKKELGDCYLRASWAERLIEAEGKRSLESIELEKECQSKALKYFEDALKIKQIEESPEDIYLMGELSRRTGNFDQATHFFEKASLTIKGEKYYCVILEDAGPDKKLISKKIREVSSINRKKSFFLIDNVPSKILGILTLEEAEKKASEYHSLGAKVSVKEDDEIPKDRKWLLNLINAMQRFTLEKNSSGQLITNKYVFNPSVNLDS